MFTLYLDGTLKNSNSGKSFSNATQCVFLLAAYCEHLNLNACLVQDEDCELDTFKSFDDNTDCVNMLTINGFRLPKSCFKEVIIIKRKDLPNEIQNCNLPAIFSDGGNYIISGLCHILRILVKEPTINSNSNSVKLLGHKKFCLKATSEVSSRGNLCEVVGPRVIDEWLCSCIPYSAEKIPSAIIQLEKLLSQPVAIHNMDKKQRVVLQRLTDTITTGVDNNPLPSQAKVAKTDQKHLRARKLNVRTNDLPPLEHVFVEGVELMISDLALLPLVHAYLMCYCKDLDTMKTAIPNTILWYHRLQNLPRIIRAARLCSLTFLDVHHVLGQSKMIIHNEEEILQLGSKSSDNIFQNLKKKDLEKTIRRDLPTILEKIASLAYDSSEQFEAVEINLQWDKLPSGVHPTMGELSSKRAMRKCQQIENILHAVKSMSADGDVIVDFCAGGGHVGIVTAHMLPKCKVVILENKEESLDRARARINSLGLTNVVVYQCNLQNYNGNFDIGLALHACGVATDLVLNKCLRVNASFVISPCCYGKIQNTHHILYPQSKRVQNVGIGYQEFILLGHAGDQTSWDFQGEKAQQGKHCMELIDMDRISFARENGYQSSLVTLQPHNCSPKNNLIVGIAPQRTAVV